MDNKIPDQKLQSYDRYALQQLLKKADQKIKKMPIGWSEILYLTIFKESYISLSKNMKPDLLQKLFNIETMFSIKIAQGNNIYEEVQWIKKKEGDGEEIMNVNSVKLTRLKQYWKEMQQKKCKIQFYINLKEEYVRELLQKMKISDRLKPKYKLYEIQNDRTMVFLEQQVLNSKEEFAKKLKNLFLSDALFMCQNQLGNQYHFIQFKMEYPYQIKKFQEMQWKVMEYFFSEIFSHFIGPNIQNKTKHLQKIQPDLSIQVELNPVPRSQLKSRLEKIIPDPKIRYLLCHIVYDLYHQYLPFDDKIEFLQANGLQIYPQGKEEAMGKNYVAKVMYFISEQIKIAEDFCRKYPYLSDNLTRDFEQWKIFQNSMHQSIKNLKSMQVVQYDPASKQNNESQINEQ